MAELVDTLQCNTYAKRRCQFATSRGNPKGRWDLRPLATLRNGLSRAVLFPNFFNPMTYVFQHQQPAFGDKAQRPCFELPLVVE